MRLLIITFLFILFGSNSSFAKKNITIEEIEGVFFGEKHELKHPSNSIDLSRDAVKKRVKETKRLMKERAKRKKLRGIAKCLYKEKIVTISEEEQRQCRAKVVRSVFTYPEKSKKKRPGDIFYALDAMKYFTDNWKDDYQSHVKIFWLYNDDEQKPGMVCSDKKYNDYKKRYERICKKFKKSTLKKIEKFQKDPTNEKVLGKKILKFIKHKRMFKNIDESIGFSKMDLLGDRYDLLGDLLNDSVKNVVKIDIPTDLNKQRIYLNKYDLVLQSIKEKLKENKYKLLNKEVKTLSNIFSDLKSLSPENQLSQNVDKAVDEIFDIHIIIENNVLKSKESEEHKNLVYSSIYIMQYFIDKILTKIPEKYYSEQKVLSKELWTDDELKILEDGINSMIETSKRKRNKKFNESITFIEKFNTSIDVLKLSKKINNLGFNTNIDDNFNQDTVSRIVQKNIKENLDKSILPDIKKILKEVDKNEMAEITRQATEVAKVITKDSQTKSFLDRKIGNHSMKTLIGAHRAGYIDLGIGNR